MRDFKKTVRALRAGEMEALASGLLTRLEGRESSSGAAAAQYRAEEPSLQEQHSRAALHQAVERAVRTLFPETVGEFEQGKKREMDENGEKVLDKGGWAWTGEQAAMQAQALLEKEGAGGSSRRREFTAGEYALRSRNDAAHETEMLHPQQVDMADISEFFRRDGRRYDSGFKRY